VGPLGGKNKVPGCENLQGKRKKIIESIWKKGHFLMEGIKSRKVAAIVSKQEELHNREDSNQGIPESVRDKIHEIWGGKSR